MDKRVSFGPSCFFQILQASPPGFAASSGNDYLFYTIVHNVLSPNLHHALTLGPPEELRMMSEVSNLTSSAGALGFSKRLSNSCCMALVYLGETKPPYWQVSGQPVLWTDEGVLTTADHPPSSICAT